MRRSRRSRRRSVAGSSPWPLAATSSPSSTAPAPANHRVTAWGDFKGPLTLPATAGEGWIEIRSTGVDDLAPGRRSPRPTRRRWPRSSEVRAPSRRAHRAGAHHVRFVGSEFAVTPGAYSTGLVRFGSGDETRVEDLPHHLVIDRCWVHGDPERGGKRGVALNARHVAVIDSYLSDWKAPGQETQAIAGWNGAGPFKIVNNYIEAAGVNVLFGGADPTIPNLVPSDIEIRGNHFSKPVAWRTERWMVKNLLELKNARRVVVAGNLLEHSWGQAQDGTAVLFSPRNQDGRAPWSGGRRHLRRQRRARRRSGVRIMGHDDSGPADRRAHRDPEQPVRGLDDGLRQRASVHAAARHRRRRDRAQHGFPSTTVITAEGPRHEFCSATTDAARGLWHQGSGLATGEPTLRRSPGRALGNVFIGRDVPRSRATSPSGDAGGRFVIRSARLAAARGQPLQGYRRRPRPRSGRRDSRARPAAARRMMVEALFWTAVGVLAYTFVGYPALAWSLARVAPRRVRRQDVQPTVTVLVAAHNEAAVIAGRIENCLALEYPPERLEIVIASDGSTDGTVEEALRFERPSRPGPCVRVVAYPWRRGKPSVLNDTIPRCQGDIVVLADSRQRYDADAVRRLAENFADPAVGAASGELTLVNEAGVAVGEGVGAYWRYEK